jgi:hypothetical protein
MPTGAVTFSDNGKAVHTATLNAEGNGGYNAPFSIGSHSVTASYSGDTSYNTSTASTIAFSVAQNSPDLYLGASNQTNDTQVLQVIGGIGQPTVFNVLVENSIQNKQGLRSAIAAPTGTIGVTGFPSGVPTSGTLSAGVDPFSGAVAGIATITVPASTATGLYTLSISYSGDSNYTSVPTETGSVQIVSGGLTASTTTATASGSISPTTSILVTGTVTGAGSTAPTGNVYVYSSGNYIAGTAIASGTGDVSNFSIVLNSQNLSQGTNFVTLQYFGDTKYNPSAFTLSTPISNPLADFTLVPSTTIIPITPGSNGTATINLASVNGFSGAVSLSCKAASGVTCSIPSSETLASGGSANATLTVNAASSTASGTYNVLITGTDPTGKYVHTLGIQAAVSAGLGFSLNNSGNITVAHGAMAGNTVTIGVSPTGGFTGTVDLSCAVTVVPTGASSPVTCSIPATVNITGTTAATATLTVGSTVTTTKGAYAIEVTGKDAATGKLISGTVSNVTVTGLVSTVTVTPSATTITTGQSVQVAVAVTGTGGTATGTLNLYGLEGGTVGNGYSLGGTLSNGAYTFNLTPGLLYAGTETLTATYSGDATYASGTGTTTVTVTALTPTITVIPSPTSIYTNQSMTVSGMLSGTGPTPTGTVTLTGGGAQAGGFVASDGSYSIVVPPGSLSAGIDTLTVTYNGDRIYATVNGSTTVTVTQFVLLTPTVTVTPPTGSADSGLSLNVPITVTGTSGTPTGTVTLSGGGYTSTPVPLIGGTFTVTIPPNTLSAGSVTLTASYNGNSTYAAATGTTTFTVTQSAFTVAATAVTIASPGSGGTSTITVSSTTGYAGGVTIACSLTTSPSGATDLPSCSPGGSTVELFSGTTSGTTTVSVTTTGATSEVVYPKIDGKRRGWVGAGGGTTLALVVFLAIPARRRSWRSMLGMMVFLAALGSISACGGGSGGGGGGGGGSGGGGNAGTTAGTYTFTVTGTGTPSQSTGNTTTFTVTVN